MYVPFEILPAESGESLTKADLVHAFEALFDAPAESNLVLKLFDGYIYRRVEEGVYAPACVTDVAVTQILYADATGKKIQFSGACSADPMSDLVNSEDMAGYTFVAEYNTETKRGVFQLEHIIKTDSDEE